MRNPAVRPLKAAAFVLCALLPLISFAQKDRPMIRMAAPALGVTAHGVVLVWDDVTEPDYQSVNPHPAVREYLVYRDRVKIGSTRNHTFTVKGLSPAHTYSFLVSAAGRGIGPISSGPLVVTTEKTGGIFNVTAFGAKGDGQHEDGPAIQKAVDRCTPGGVVVVPAGRYRIGHLDLKSHITLQLEKDAVLAFSGYDPDRPYAVTKAVLPGPDGDIHYESPSLITGIDVHQVAITGEGTIDGNGETWWPHYKEITRPFTIEFILSSGILIQGITIRDPPFWNNHLLYVDSALYSAVRFLKVSRAPGVNGDGLDPDASSHVLIVGCLFGNQDDCIAIKSGKYLSDGNKRRRPSEDITIRDCVFDGDAAPGANPLGIALGSESSGGIRHVVIQHCVFNDVASLVNIKTNRQRPFAHVEDVRIDHIVYKNRKAVDRWWNRAPISVDLFYGEELSDPSVAQPLSSQTPAFRDIHFSNISIDNTAGRGIYISGLRESPVRDLSLNRVFVVARDSTVIQNVDAISISAITVENADQTKRRSVHSLKTKL